MHMTTAQKQAAERTQDRELIMVKTVVKIKNAACSTEMSPTTVDGPTYAGSQISHSKIEAKHDFHIK
jgi:hypothetical protein